MSGNIQLTQEQFQQLISVVGSGQKNTPANVGTLGPYAHGQYGLFTTPGQMGSLSAVMTGFGGILGALPVQAAGTSAPDGQSADTPLTTIITGVSQGDSEKLANQRDNLCEQPPIGGLLKAITLTRPYGRFSGRTRPLAAAEYARKQNYAESFAPQVQNMNLSLQQDALTSSVIPRGGNGIIHNELMKRVFEMQISHARYLAPILWTGTPANNSAGGGYKEPVGLETIINTGNKQDAIDGTPSARLDSLLWDFNNNLVSSTNPNLSDWIDHMFAHLEYRAREMNLDPVEWAVVMRQDLFDELIKTIPVNKLWFALEQMNNFTNGRVVMDGGAAERMREDMYNNKYIPAYFRNRPVILDNAMPEESGENGGWGQGNQWASDIYIIPMSVLGGYRTAYLEAFQYEVPTFINNIDSMFVTDNGRFFWTYNQQDGCFEYQFMHEFRITVEATWLAGRIQNVAYQPYQHFDSPFPAGPAEAYFINGGRTNQGATDIFQNFYTEWGGDTPVSIPGAPR